MDKLVNEKDIWSFWKTLNTLKPNCLGTYDEYRQSLLEAGYIIYCVEVE